jgi:hypothetical protein
LLLGLVASVRVVHAQASTPACAGLPVHLQGAFTPRWQEALEHACVNLTLHKDLDRSALLRVIMTQQDQLQLDVILADGRTTQRRLSAPDDLLKTIEALLVLPIWLQTDTHASLTHATRAATDRAEDSERPPALLPLRATVISPEVSTRLGVEIGIEAAVRLARAPTYLNPALALYAGILPEAWWLGIELRWEPYQYPLRVSPPSDFQMDSMAGGLLVARRVSLGFVNLNIGMNLLAAATFQTFDLHGGAERSETLVDVRTGAICRVLLGTAAWRGSLSLGIDVSPLRVRRSVALEADLPAVPVWSLGLGLGIAWGNR